MLAAALFLAVFSWDAQADGVITSISLNVEADLKVGEKCHEDDITVTPRSDRYEVTDLEIMNESDYWGPLDMPKISVILTAEEGYSFSLNRSRIKINGGEYEFGRRWDYNDDQYQLIIRLPSLRKQVGAVENAGWTSLTEGAWNEAYNAGSYELRLYRDGKLLGFLPSVTENHFDFGSYMHKPGSYRYQARAVNASDSQIKSEWSELSAVSLVDQAGAEQIGSRYESLVPAGVTEPGQMAEIQAKANEAVYGWILDGIGWWYRNPDGSYTAGNWQQIDGKWYYFDSRGYMATGWIDWDGKSYYCDPETGAMLVSTMVPDGLGRRVDSTGALIE